MEPAQRKMKILEAVVEAYIRTGEPVGSKVLCDTLDFTVSSATIRNDMAELSSLGLLEQPHTSSGRVPTRRGLRVYLDKLIKPVPLDVRGQSLIKDALYLCTDAPEHLLEKAAELLADITGCAAVASAPSGERSLIRRIRFVQTGSYTAMAVLMTSTGSVKTKLFRCDYLLNAELVEMFEEIMNERLAGRPVTSVTPAFIQSAAVSLGEMSMLMPNVLIALHDAAQEAAATNIAIKGQSNLFIIPELRSADGKTVMDMLGRSAELSRLISDSEAKPHVLIGSELRNPALANLSVIAARYTAAPDCTGSLAVIGPVRMDYPAVISTLEYVTASVGALLGELLEG